MHEFYKVYADDDDNSHAYILLTLMHPASVSIELQPASIMEPRIPRAMMMVLGKRAEQLFIDAVAGQLQMVQHTMDCAP